MTGLKSGSGDDLWGDDADEESDEPSDPTEADGQAADRDREGPGREEGQRDDRGPESNETERGDPGFDEAEGDGETADATRGKTPEAATEGVATEETETPAPDDGRIGADASTGEIGSTTDTTSYIVRRAVQDKSVQFERDERLTFFVHDDVTDGERDLITDIESVLGRDVPKFDVREAVYRAALRNRDDVLDELLAMGYAIEED